MVALARNAGVEDRVDFVGMISDEEKRDHYRRCLAYVPAERLSVAPDCGLSQTARWAARPKLQNLVAGVGQVRKELGLPPAA